MRVMLVQGYTMIDEAPIFPLGLCTLGACLSDRHEVQVFDTNVTASPVEDLSRRLAEFQPHVVGVSLRNIKVARPGSHETTVPLYRRLLDAVRAVVPDAVLLGGGAGFSLYAEPLMAKLPQLDLGVYGEADLALPELLDKLDRPQDVPGVFLRENGAVRYTGDRPWLEYRDVPWPRYDLVDLKHYVDNPTGLGVMTKRGCLLRCLHCSDRNLLGPQARMRDPHDVAEHLQYLHDEHGVRQFMFADQVFNMPQQHAEAICQEMVDRRLGMKWIGWFNEKPITREFVRLARESGCQVLDFSPDSISDDVLRTLRKNIRQADIENVVRLCREERMPVDFNFMLNGPGETLGSMLRMGAFLVKTKLRLRGLFRLHGLCMVLMRIYPQTELHALAIEKGLVRPDDDLIEPVYYNPPPLNRVADVMLGALHAAWAAKQLVKLVLRRGRPAPPAGVEPHV